MVNDNDMNRWRHDGESVCLSSECRTFVPTWFHFAVTWNGTSGQSFMYKNGVPIWNDTSSLVAFKKRIVPGGIYLTYQLV
jgi:hypothetical protein